MLWTLKVGLSEDGGERLSRAYAYGAERSTTGDLQTDRAITGHKSDTTGLLYHNARCDSPPLAAFISPDSPVPDAGIVIDYNRFPYRARQPLISPISPIP